jgi:hypothetical protein
MQKQLDQDEWLSDWHNATLRQLCQQMSKKIQSLCPTKVIIRFNRRDMLYITSHGTEQIDVLNDTLSSCYTSLVYQYYIFRVCIEFGMTPGKSLFSEIKIPIEEMKKKISVRCKELIESELSKEELSFLEKTDLNRLLYLKTF